MPQDFLVRQDEYGQFDLQISGSDFATIDGFETAILVSLFSDARAPASSVQEAQSRRGWVGDVLAAGSGRGIGSLLWLYEQSRITAEIKNQIADAARRCMQWMVADGVAQSVAASVTESTLRSVTIRIDIVTIAGDVQSYAVLWRNTNGANISSI